MTSALEPGLTSGSFLADLPGAGRTLADTPLIAPAGLPDPPAPEGAPVDRLGARLRALAARNTADPVYDYPIPGWDGLLVARYRLLDEETVTRLRAEATATETTLVEFYASVLVAHCVGVLAREDNGRLVSADLASPERPAPGFDVRLAAALGCDFFTATDLLRRVYRTTGFVLSTYQALEADCGYQRAEEIRASRGNA